MHKSRLSIYIRQYAGKPVLYSIFLLCFLFIILFSHHEISSMFFFSTLPVYAETVDTSEFSDIKEELLSAIRTDKEVVNLSEKQFQIDISNGEHILSDFQDDFLFEYSEDTFCVENMTFVHDNGKIETVYIHYTDDIADRQRMRQELSLCIDEIVSNLDEFETTTDKIGEISRRIWQAYDDDREGDLLGHSYDAYGCLVEHYAYRNGAACAFQACMKRLGYTGSYYLDFTNSGIYNKTLLDGEWKYTNIPWNQSRANNTYLLIDKKESVRTYSKVPLTSTEYTPISLFSANPYLSQYNRNSQYIRDQILAGNTVIELPDEIFCNYRSSIADYCNRLKHEYSEYGILVRTGSSSIQNHKLYMTITYNDSDANVREEKWQKYCEIRDAIVERANQFKTDEEKVIFVNNYLCKIAIYEEYTDGVYRQNSHNAYGCLVEGKCVCEGYSTAFHDIMKELGIKDEYIQKYNHIWNRVVIDGEYKVVDVTNNDGTNLYLLSDNHKGLNSHIVSSYLYVMNETLSMKSQSTKYLINEIAKKKTHIDTSCLDFWVDKQTVDFDLNWYEETLRNIYPNEMMFVSDLLFYLEDGKIVSVDVTYQDYSKTQIDQFEEYVNQLVSNAQTKSTKEEQAYSVLMAVNQKSFTKTNSSDVLVYALENQGNYLAKTQLACVALERLGIRFSVLKDHNNYPYIKIVYDGVPKYSCCVMRSYNDSYINRTNILSYSSRNDYPVFELFDIPAENVYLNMSPVPVLYGDANEDGFVDTDDAMLVLQYYAGLIPSSQISFVNANVDGNHMVDSDDAMLILQYYARIITQFPVNSFTD